jgi:hypothetical protein
MGRRTLLMASQPCILYSMPEITVSDARGRAAGEWGTVPWCFSLQLLILARRNILYLPSEISEHRE